MAWIVHSVNSPQDASVPPDSQAIHNTYTTNTMTSTPPPSLSRTPPGSNSPGVIEMAAENLFHPGAGSIVPSPSSPSSLSLPQSSRFFFYPFPLDGIISPSI